jgi:hypothetical protein
MAVTPSGAISLGAVNNALNRTTTARISISDVQVRFLANRDFGSVNMNAMRNKQSTVGTITVGVSDDGFNVIFGYLAGSIGGVSANSFFGHPLVELYNAATVPNQPDIMSAGGATLGDISARMNVNNGQIKAMSLVPGSAVYRGFSPPAFFTSEMVGGTYPFQFAQT